MYRSRGSERRGGNGPRALKLNAVKSSVLCTGTTSRAALVLTRQCNVLEVPSVPRLLRVVVSRRSCYQPPLIVQPSSFETWRVPHDPPSASFNAADFHFEKLLDATFRCFLCVASVFFPLFFYLAWKPRYREYSPRNVLMIVLWIFINFEKRIGYSTVTGM